jgi:hypothetical protein
MQSQKIEVRCECGSHETITSLMDKVERGAEELQRLVTADPMDFLLSSVAYTEPCEACNGTGYIVVPNGPDDVDKETCTECDGRGYTVAANF